MLNSSSHSPFCKKHARIKNQFWLNFTARRITILQYSSLSWQLNYISLSCSLFLFFSSFTVFTPSLLLNLITLSTLLLSCLFFPSPIVKLDSIKICHPCLFHFCTPLLTCHVFFLFTSIEKSLKCLRYESNLKWLPSSYLPLFRCKTHTLDQRK